MASFRWPGWWLDALLALLLFGAALPVRFAATRGDLWLDEADYAFASVRGFAANRRDASDVPEDPDKLVRLRHYHPPLVAYTVGLARRWGPGDRALRVPFVPAGGLSVALVYLCGLSLFGVRGSGFGVQSASSPLHLFTSSPLHLFRLSALACAVIVIFTPPHIRASSHALPWALIILWLLLLLWTLLKYAETRQAGWLIGAWGALGGLFVTSEVFFPALLAAACAAPFLFWPDVKAAPRRRRLLIAMLVGLVLFLGVVFTLWPAGLRGGAFKMLHHYIAMANDPWPVNVGETAYERAPKWAYLYWYWRLYRPVVVFYALGALTALALLLRRRLTAGAGALLVLTAVILFSAHRAHIIGPEYLAHALPLLTLIGGLFFAEVSRLNRPLGLAVMAAACIVIALHREPQSLSGMDARAQIPRWPDAARFLAAQWRPGDRMMAPAYGGVGRWYLLHVGGVPAKEWQVQALPAEGEAREPLLRDLLSGVYRYVAVGNTFVDRPAVDSRVWRIVRTWPVVWESDERGTGPCRLRIYRRPPLLVLKPKARYQGRRPLMALDIGPWILYIDP